ncbi:A/G-specific adenine glycosylase [Neobacillus sp. OS1-32]|uniref:Adenine DNA glycosylase n=1 Tax=Neobacillus paridis TaxID=2803862 RepID=A0ABS1TQK8_9BACI|nr:MULTISPECIES: A/G-specific adenine glycosylase [Neobacillus]MBL4953596.1 A/G-specific adenine glycosylase [Neobacillus paridis]WML32256.1 A/G-specific adenine glycosylase [Neobacillus sp. OS1-32]
MLIELNNLKKININAFQTDLISWFKKEQRNLPWRKDQDPYKVWVSEVMLQQTRVDTVIPYFNRFIDWFPTIEDLATADEEKVLKAWEGLGYYSRVRNLQSAVKEVKETYGGVVPDSPEEISKLKGVGPYTAGAILSIAYGKPEPAVDGNVMRVLSRILSIWEDIARPSSRKIFEQAVRELISHEDPSAFNQALMELGALVCTPTSPACLLCPVREHCQAFDEGVQSELPVKTKKTKTRQVQLASAILLAGNGKILIHKRPSTGLLANLWEFPNVEIAHPLEGERGHVEQLFNTATELSVTLGKVIGQVEHIFSHLLWNIKVYIGQIDGTFAESDEWKLVSPEEMEQFAFPVPYQKMFLLYQESLLN